MIIDVLHVDFVVELSIGVPEVQPVHPMVHKMLIALEVSIGDKGHLGLEFLY
jgi:hypothetical protein